ncbi:hypothetical protein [Sulfurimonas indica]|uniref:hypothetical protein n=1 Tax=Sulfurimonas TaxID=202746 RepID=UPI00165EE44D|nr:hypothetical protein [Sulfurimonas indica]
MELLKNEIKKLIFFGMTFSIEIVDFTKVRINKNTTDIFIKGSSNVLTLSNHKVQITKV